MKKSLIALLALGSLAMAEDITDTAFQKLFFTTSSPESCTLTDPTPDNKDFSYTFELNQAGVDLIARYVGSPSSGMGKSLISVIGENTGEKFGVGMGFSSSSGYITKGGAFMAITDAGKDLLVGKTAYRAVNNWLGVNTDAMKCLLSPLGISLTLTANMSKSEGTKLYTTIKYEIPGSGEYYYETIPSEETPFMADGELRWSDFKMDTLKVNPDYVAKVALYDKTLSMQEALASNHAIFTMQNVPEPATGTLSLLALAGLAARRRKK